MTLRLSMLGDGGGESIRQKSLFSVGLFPTKANRQSLTKLLRGRIIISQVYTSDKAQPYITVAIPLWGTAQSIVGVVAAEADLSFLWEVIGKIHFGTAGYAYLIDAHGNLIAHKDAALVLKRMNLRQVDGVKKFFAQSYAFRSHSRPGRAGLMDRPVLVTYAPVLS